MTGVILNHSTIIAADKRAEFHAKRRIKLLMALILLCYAIISFRLFELACGGVQNTKEIVHGHDTAQPQRHKIFDRNGVTLATNISTASLYAHPKQVLNHVETAQKLSTILKNVNLDSIKSRLLSGRKFVWIKRHITPQEQQLVHDLGIPGLYFIEDEKRFYPQENLCAHVLGYVDVDGNGIAGIEGKYNNALQSKDIQLTIDIRVQHVVRSALAEAIRANEAAGGVGIVFDASNGEILSLVSLPDFNSNHSNKATDRTIFNQATSGVYEMGSVAKALTFAIALDNNLIGINDAFDVSQPLKVDKYTIHDYRGKGGFLSTPEVFMYSSNIGTAQIGRKIGSSKQREYLNKLGMLSPLSFDLPETSKPLYPRESKWSDVYNVTISYGHGVAVTALHAVQAIAATINGGILHRPKLLLTEAALGPDSTANDSVPAKRIFKDSTSRMMRKLLRLTVTNGTGRKANAEGYIVIGKSGTAEKNYKGRYQRDQNLVVFSGAFPGNEPRYLVFIAIDAPKPNKANASITTGGQVAAPVAGQIISKIAPILGIFPQDETSPRIVQALNLHYSPRYSSSAVAHNRH